MDQASTNRKNDPQMTIVIISQAFLFVILVLLGSIYIAVLFEILPIGKPLYHITATFYFLVFPLSVLGAIPLTGSFISSRITKRFAVLVLIYSLFGTLLGAIVLYKLSFLTYLRAGDTVVNDGSYKIEINLYRYILLLYYFGANFLSLMTIFIFLVRYQTNVVSRSNWPTIYLAVINGGILLLYYLSSSGPTLREPFFLILALILFGMAISAQLFSDSALDFQTEPTTVTETEQT